MIIFVSRCWMFVNYVWYLDCGTTFEKRTYTIIVAWKVTWTCPTHHCYSGSNASMYHFCHLRSDMSIISSLLLGSNVAIPLMKHMMSMLVAYHIKNYLISTLQTFITFVGMDGPTPPKVIEFYLYMKSLHDIITESWLTMSTFGMRWTSTEFCQWLGWCSWSHYCHMSGRTRRCRLLYSIVAETRGLRSMLTVGVS